MIDSMSSPEPKPMIILIAVPYQSGTDGDLVRIAANLRRLEEFSLPIYRAGHVPMIGEWAALPILHGAGGGTPGSATYDAEMHPTAHRLLARCDGVLRLPGASTGADNDVAIATHHGIPVWFKLDDIPAAG